MTANEYNKNKVNESIFLLLLAIYFVFVFNLPFLVKVFIYFKSANNNAFSHTFALIPCLICIFVSLFSLLFIKKLAKIIFIFLTLLSAILSYNYLYYGVIFDTTSPLVDTLLHASLKEISLFLTPSFFIYFIVLGLLPTYWIYNTKIEYYSWKKRFIYRGIGICIYPLFYATTQLPLAESYQPIVRWSGLAGKAYFQIIPTNFFESFYDYHYKTLIKPIPYKQIGLDAKIKHNHNNLLVIVIGETARGMNFELNGYARSTNYYTKKEKVISFPKVTACGTCTRLSVPCIFSAFPRKKFLNLMADRQDNVLDILSHAGVNLLWVDNNGNGDCQGVCKNIKTIILNEPFDISALKIIKNQLINFSQQDTVIVLHLRGSHGIDYYTKYPEKFRKFTPECRHNEFRLCNQESLTNAYDNSLLYTDFVIAKLIRILKAQTTFKHTAMLYTSDHGESLGEHDLHEHCSPYAIAPVEQTHVPLIFWASKNFLENTHLSLDCLKNQAYTNHYSHDNLFHSILGLMDVSTEVYNPNLDIFNGCRHEVS